MPDASEARDGDPHRPRYHFLPPCNWMNDPNGLIQRKGEYHLFYQHNPQAAVWGDMHWGHAVSDDLIHWRHLPIALAPTPGGPDEAGCFSGCAVVNELPTLIFTGTRGQRNEVQTQCLATSTDGLLTWIKDPRNPVLSDMPAELGQTSDFRDPFVWSDGDGWSMVVGSRMVGAGGAVLRYRSVDLVRWEYLGPLLVGDGQRYGAMWECPNFFPLGERWVLIVSTHTGSETDTVRYFVGEFHEGRFTPTSEGVLDYGALYAPLTFLDEQGRRLLVGWLRETRPVAEQEQAGWSGVQSIPRELALDAQDRLRMTPVPALAGLRGAHWRSESGGAGAEVSYCSRGLALEVLATLLPGQAGSCGIRFTFSPALAERCEITYQVHEQRLIVRNLRIDNEHIVESRRWEIPHALGDKEPLMLRVLLDGSVMEIVANSRTSVGNRLYPSQAEACVVELLGESAGTLEIWEVASIWDEPSR